MKLIAQCGALALGALAGAAAAQAPAPKDFAYGLAVTTAPGLPVQQFTLPDRVYQGITRGDLRDLRVFNSGGIVVPHALCTATVIPAATVSEASLNVFALQPGARNAGTADTRVNVQTQSGTSVQVIERPAQAAGNSAIIPSPAADPDTFVVDATSLKAPVRALQLAWSTPDGASQASVRVEASDDLDRWHTVVANTTLLHVTADGRTLDRNRIELPSGTYRYLRLARSDGPAVRIERVTAEVVHPGAPAEPFWFAASPSATVDAGGYVFDTGRLAPVQAARVELPVANMTLHVALDSRQGLDGRWDQRWSGDVWSVRLDADQVGAGHRTPPAAAFFPVADAHWRLRVLRGAESLQGGRPSLQLGYHPARVRFLTQGEGPFLVAYGSARVAPAESAGCNTLVEQFGPSAGESLVGIAKVEPAPAGPFGGPEVLTPPPPPTPVRQIVLWAVLLLGTAALVAMALSLLKRLRENESAR